jgi:hypothetical protein
MSRFMTQKLDKAAELSDNSRMETTYRSPATSRHATRFIRERIERGGERLWRLQDFKELPPTAVAQALSRLTKAGMIERLSKGIYYRTRPTILGESRPNPTAIRKLAAKSKAMFPAGIAAANLLGFTTQNPKLGELSTSARSLPRKLIGDKTIIHTRRPEAWANLSDSDAALLDFLRQRGNSSELSPEATIQRILLLLSDQGRFERLLKAAYSEPPRIRAMLGALGQQLGKEPKALRNLRASLNPLSRFDFGLLSGLSYAREWQAKEREREII